MPIARIEATAASDEAAANVDAPSAPPAAGGFKAWLPLIVSLVVMPVLAYAMTTYVLLPRLQRGLGIDAVTTANPADLAKPAPGSKKQAVAMTKVLVNVSGTMGSRYLMVSLSIMGTDPEFSDKVKEYEPQLRDMACGTLSSKTLVDLEKAGARNQIRTELISGFNTILGRPIVQEIFLTEFAIQ